MEPPNGECCGGRLVRRRKPSMSTRRVVVVGYGRVGQAAVEAVLEAPDMVLAGVIRRDPTQRGELPPHIPVVAEVAQLGKVDGALLCVPTRQVQIGRASCRECEEHDYS